MEQAPPQIPDAPIRIDIGGIDVNQIADTGSLNIGETYNFRLQTGQKPNGNGKREQERDPRDAIDKGRDR